MSVSSVMSHVVLLSARPIGSAALTTIGTGFTLLDGAEILTKSSLNPLAFAISATVGVILATLFYKGMNQNPEFSKSFVENGLVPKFFWLSTSSVILGTLPALLSKISSFVAQFFFRSSIGGFRVGFLTTQAILQGIDTYPLLDADPEDQEQTSEIGDGNTTPNQVSHSPRNQEPPRSSNSFYGWLASFGSPNKRNRSLS